MEHSCPKCLHMYLKVDTALFFPFTLLQFLCLSVYCTFVVLELCVCFGCEYAAFPQVIWREKVV